MTPWYLYKAYKGSYNPGDLEVMQFLQNKFPKADMSKFSRPNLHPFATEAEYPRPTMSTQRTTNDWKRPSDDAESVITIEPPKPQSRGHWKSCSRVDMSTGISSVDRGFDFATEERGVEMRRVQTNLSEKRAHKSGFPWRHSRNGSGSSKSDKGKRPIGRSLSKAFSRKKPPPSE